MEYCPNCGADLSAEGDEITLLLGVDGDKDNHNKSRYTQSEDTLVEDSQAAYTQSEYAQSGYTRAEYTQSDYSQSGYTQSGNTYSGYTSPSGHTKPTPPHSSKSSMPVWIPILIVALVLFLAGGGVGGYYYYKNVYLPKKIDSEAARFYPIVNVFVRSTKNSEGHDNKIGLVSAGGELITYEHDEDWSRVKYVPADPSEPVMEGYVSTDYLLSKSDYDLLNGIFGNEEAREVIGTAKCRRALLKYYKDNALVGKAVDGDTINPQPADDNQWQIFLSSVSVKPNEVYFKRVLNAKSKFTDFAVVMKNIVNNKGRLLYFVFDDDETPHLIAEYSLSYPGKITNISYNPYRPNNLAISTTAGTPVKTGTNVLQGYTYEGEGHIDGYAKMKIKFVNNRECLVYMRYGGDGEMAYDAPIRCTYTIKGSKVTITNNVDREDFTLNIMKNASGLYYRDNDSDSANPGWISLSRL